MADISLLKRLRILRHEKERRLATKRLINFTEYTYPRFERADHHSLVCAKLEEVEQKVRDGEGARLLITMPPRHTKSELVSRRFPAFVMGRNPWWQLIFATYSGDFANDFGREVRDIVASEEFDDLFPDVHLKQDSKAANRWHTNHNGIYVAVGVGGPTTGRGAHIFIIDDPFKDLEEADSELIREKRWNWYQTVVRTRLMPGAAIIVTMTRWNDDDIAGRLLKEMEAGDGEKFDLFSLPALADSDDDPLGRKKGEALWPAWFPADDLIKTKSVLADRHWNALYQQNPIPEEGSYFKKDWIEYYGMAPKHLRIYGASDYAVTEGGGDCTEHGVFGIDENDDLYVLAWWFGKTESAEWIESMLDLVRVWKPIDWFGEAGQIRRAVEPFLNRRMEERKDYCNVEYLASINDKPTRARSIQARLSMHKVFFPKADWATRIIRQMMRFPASADDDAVDVLSMIGRAINLLETASKPKPKPKKSWKDRLKAKARKSAMAS